MILSTHTGAEFSGAEWSDAGVKSFETSDSIVGGFIISIIVYINHRQTKKTTGKQLGNANLSINIVGKLIVLVQNFPHSYQ